VLIAALRRASVSAGLPETPVWDDARASRVAPPRKRLYMLGARLDEVYLVVPIAAY